MAPRLELQEVLESLLGSRNVYFQPPLNLKMNYPCIIYKRDDAETEFARISFRDAGTFSARSTSC